MHEILVHIRNHHSWGHAAAYAADLAARMSASLTGAYVEPSPLAMAMPYPAPDVQILARQTVHEDEARAAKVADRFTTWAKSYGVPEASWQVAEGDIPRSLARLADRHDLLVLDRNCEDPAGTARMLGTIVLSSGLPCIVVPPRKREANLERIALAWNHSAESMRAMHAALPLLSHATNIILLAAEAPEENPEHGWMPAFDIDQYLAHQGLKVEREMIRGADSEAGELILAASRRHRADLLVMGAYGRTRFSEWMLGGATRSVLMDAPLPVFLKH